MSGAHDHLVREQFRAQAVTFTDEGFATRGLEWIVALLAPASGELVLDVAAGAAHLGRALAPHVAHVSALDLTPEMLRQGQRLAAARGLPNIAFVVGDATALPWTAQQFDLVVCRLALHQAGDPAAIVREMLRVTRSTGRIGITDLTVDDDPVVAAETNRLERLRDPSHNRTLTFAEIRTLLTDNGASITATARRDHPLDLEDWMSRTGTPGPARSAIRERFGRELAGGQATGLRPYRSLDGTISFNHQWVTVTAVPHRHV
jgi:SAM-dependent methyltransferase